MSLSAKIIEFDPLYLEYERDFCAWLERNASLLRQGRVSEIDMEHLAEELEGMSRSEHHNLLNRLRMLLAHLLKWQFQASHRSNSWKATIREQRLRILELLESSPSLKHRIGEKAEKAYAQAVGLAADETGLPASGFPGICPYPLEKALDLDFLP